MLLRVGSKPHLPQLADSISVNTSTSAMSAMHQRRRFEGNMRLPSPQPNLRDEAFELRKKIDHKCK